MKKVIEWNENYEIGQRAGWRYWVINGASYLRMEWISGFKSLSRNISDEDSANMQGGLICMSSGDVGSDSGGEQGKVLSNDKGVMQTASEFGKVQN